MSDTLAWWILAGCLVIDLFALVFVAAYWPKDPWGW